MSEKKTTWPSLKKPRLENCQGRNWKINELLTHITTKNITKLNELIDAGAKLVYDKSDVPLKNTNRNSKPEWEIWLKMQIRNLRKQAKMIRQRRNAGTYLVEKEKATQVKQTIQYGEINSKLLVKEGRLKRYRDRIKQCRQKKTSKQQKNYQQVRGEYLKTYQQLDDKVIKQFRRRIWDRRT